MRITHICFLGPVTDGFTYQDNLLTKYQQIQGHQVTIICSQWIMGKQGLMKDHRKQYINENGITVIRLPTHRNREMRFRFKRYEKVLETLEETKPEIVFIHGIQFLDALVIKQFLKKNKNVIAFADNHTDFNNSAKNWLSLNILHKGIWKTMARQLEPYIKRFYGVLPARVDFLIDVYGLPKNKCELLVLGADDAEVARARDSIVRKSKRDEYGIKDGQVILLAGGKIDNNKPQIIDLMRAVNRSSCQKFFLLVFGSIEDSLRASFEEQLSSCVRFVGWKNASEMYDEFSAADIVAFPGLHSVLWEQAVGMGKPCIFKRIQGFEHIDLGGNCLFFEEDTIDCYCKTIQDAINQLPELTKNAEEKGIPYFSYREIAKKSIGDYQS